MFFEGQQDGRFFTLRGVEQRRVKERPLVKSLASADPADAAQGVLSHFRVEFYDCLYSRADALFELTDTVRAAQASGLGGAHEELPNALTASEG